MGPAHERRPAHRLRHSARRPGVVASSLAPRDQFHHWSKTGGLWAVDARLRDGRIKCHSDLGAVRYFTTAYLDAKGIRLIVRGEDL